MGVLFTPGYDENARDWWLRWGTPSKTQTKETGLGEKKVQFQGYFSNTGKAGSYEGVGLFVKEKV